jgi:hypothetical protein
VCPLKKTQKAGPHEDHFSDIDGVLNCSRPESPQLLGSASPLQSALRRPFTVPLFCALPRRLKCPTIIGIQLPKQSNKLAGQRF